MIFGDGWVVCRARNHEAKKEKKNTTKNELSLDAGV